jgi:hypothetical protein
MSRYPTCLPFIKTLSKRACADVRNGSFVGSRLENADLISTNMRQADLQKANLQNANLEDADLFGADLGQADLTGARLAKADLRNTRRRVLALHFLKALLLALRFFLLQASRPVACTSDTVTSTSSDDLLSCHYFRPMRGTQGELLQRPGAATDAPPKILRLITAS